MKFYGGSQLSRQKKKPHGKKENTHGKRKNLTAKRKDSRQKEVCYFAVGLFLLAVRFFPLAVSLFVFLRGYFFRRDSCGPPKNIKKHRTEELNFP